VDDNRFGVPAGWYPDPLGLPQLRWWDAQAWTEHTSEARAPIVVQPATRLAYADDEPEEHHAFREDFPSRREQRERERRENGDLLEASIDTETGIEREELSAQPLLDMTLRELEPPVAATVDDFTPGPKRASAHTNAAPRASTLSALAEELAPQRAPKQMKTYTGAVWAIALMPALQLIVAILLITVFSLGNNLPLMLLFLFGPYLIVLGLAAYDRLVLQVWGHARPASAWWALLTEPGYLIVRAIRTFGQTGKGFAPLGGFAGSLGAVLAGMIILPGLLISVLPDAFASEAERSVQADASALGVDIAVTCPAPPLLIGETFTCIRTMDNGETDSVAVSLQRLNGWISWQVEDWGPSVMGF